MIRKYLQGGNALPPLVSYLPVVVTGGAQPAASFKESKEDSSSDLTDKDLLEMLGKLDGLPSDMAILTLTLLNFYIDLLYGVLSSTSNIATRYLLTLNQMKVANANKKEYDNAFDIVSKNGGINELAISDRGLLYCVNNEGDFRLLSLEELKQNSEYLALTNSDLLYYRYESPKLANNNNLIKVVKNGISMEVVNKLVLDIINGLGTSSNQREGYISKLEQNISGGVDILQEAVSKGVLDLGLTNLSINGLYKTKLITKLLAQQSSNAIKYIYLTLPENAKTLLKLKSDGTEEGVLKLLINLITSLNSDSVEFSLDLEKGVDAKGNAIKKEKDDSDKINLAEAFLLDKGVEVVIPIIAGSSDALRILAYMLPVTSKDGTPLGITTLDKVASNSALGGLFDFSNVTMGDLTLDMASTQHITVDGSSIYKVYLPYDLKKAEQGIIAPNLELLGLLEVVKKKIKETGATTPEEINNIYLEANLPPFVDLTTGQINEEYYKPFGMMNATALSDAFKDPYSLSTSPLLEELDDETEINNYWNILKGADFKKKFDSKRFFNYVGMGDYLQMFKGMIYLPLKSTDLTLGAYSGGDTPTYELLNKNRAAWLLSLRIETLRPQGLLLL